MIINRKKSPKNLNLINKFRFLSIRVDLKIAGFLCDTYDPYDIAATLYHILGVDELHNTVIST